MTGRERLLVDLEAVINVLESVIPILLIVAGVAVLMSTIIDKYTEGE